MEITFVRHGESQWNAGLTNNLDSSLTELGEKQVFHTAERLLAEAAAKPFTHAFVSPFRRTLETFYPFREAVAGSITAYPNVCEFISNKDGRYDNFNVLSASDIIAQFPGIDTTLLNDNGGIWWPLNENVADLKARAAKLATALKEEFGDSDANIVIVSHADPIGRFAEALLEWPPLETERAPWTDNCGIWKILSGRKPGTGKLIAQNDISHLELYGLGSEFGRI